ncbi:MAG: alpha-amylase, partial [Ignavibacteriae bacterium]|nr:alpha-amylase [Ignavibacteriota bacterium]
MPNNNTSSDLRLHKTSHPVIYEINIRVLLNELSAAKGKRITLDKIPDELVNEWANLGIDAVWLMGVWGSGAIGLQEAKNHHGLQEEFRRVLPDVTDDDIQSSPYAVQSYCVADALGGTSALLSLRKKLAKKGIGLILDYVPNHTARDHEWVFNHPEYYIHGHDGQEIENQVRYFRTETVGGEQTLAFGRDPYFPGWTDTAKLNPCHPETRKAMIETLKVISTMCDGVRCDMAMLVLNEVFLKTWEEQSKAIDVEPVESEFWADAIAATRALKPDFLFIAEAYWNLEWPLQQLGFNFTYDKTLYDRLLKEGASSVRQHLTAEGLYQTRSARFVENHDEPRVAQALPNEPWHFAAVTVAATVPGMFLLHEGQLDGRKKKLPVQLGRRPSEEKNNVTRTFYEKLLSTIDNDVIKKGEWQLLNVRPAWNDNYSSQNIIAYTWKKGADFWLIVVNYAPLNSQGYVELDFEKTKSTSLEFRDLIGPAVYVRNADGVRSKGMYFDLPGYGMHVFDVR